MDELLTIKLRYKEPDGDRSRLLTQTVANSANRLADASVDFRFAAAVAAYGMILRGSEERGNFTLADVRALARDARGLDGRGYRAEFLQLVERAQHLSRRD
jgi:Ca-activated chloride channel family protein